MKLKKLKVENRIAVLKSRPKENERIVKKLERQLRGFNSCNLSETARKQITEEIDALIKDGKIDIPFIQVGTVIIE